MIYIREIKAREMISMMEASYKNKKLYAIFTSRKDTDAEVAMGYRDGVEYAERIRNKTQLKEYLNTLEENDDYEIGYKTAIKDYIKEG